MIQRLVYLLVFNEVRNISRLVFSKREFKQRRFRATHVNFGSGLFAHLSRDFEQTFGQIASIRVKTLGHAYKFGFKKEKKSSLPVDVRRPKAFLNSRPMINLITTSY